MVAGRRKSAAPFSLIVKDPPMFSVLAKSHPLFMAPAVALLWLVAFTFFIFLLSLLDVPGVNDHGTGQLFLYTSWLIALIAALVHVGLILRQRRASHSPD